MKKSSMASFIAGAMIFGSVGVFAGYYTATENPFPIKLNGENISMEGYNINGSTYFKLRDISDRLGGFSVDFQNNTILLAKDGYVYDTIAKTEITSDEAIALVKAYYQRQRQNDPEEMYLDEYTYFKAENCGEYYKVYAANGENMLMYRIYHIDKNGENITEAY